MELPDWLRGIVLLGRDGAEYRVVGVDAEGYLGVILKAASEIAIAGDVAVDQNDSVREMQGADGATLRTVAVDANGQIIMVPRGAGGNYLSVDDDGYLGAILKADAAVTIADNLTVEQEDSIREMQGADFKRTCLITHNPWGEYGHTDHIWLHSVAIRRAPDFICSNIMIPGLWMSGAVPMKYGGMKYENNLEEYEAVARCYKDIKAWTWSYPPIKECCTWNA